MKRENALFICNNASVLKEKISLAMMVIKNKGYDIDIVTTEDVDMPFVNEKFKMQSLLNQNYKELNKEKNNFNEILNAKKYAVIQTFDNYSTYLLGISGYNTVFTDLYIYVEDLNNNFSRLKSIIKKADNLIVNNKEDYEYIVRRKINENVHLIYDLAIDFRKYRSLDLEIMKNEARRKYNIDSSKKYVYVSDGTLNYKYIINVIKEVSSQNSDIVFIFSSTNKYLEELLKREYISSNILILENIKFLEALFVSDTVFFAKVYGFDIMPVIYSLMLGIPTIVPKNIIMNEYIEELKNGFLIENENVQKTVLAIGRSVNIPKMKLIDLKEYNYHKIAGFSVDKYIYNLSSLYSEVINSSSKDIYIIESLKKSAESERLMSDIKKNGAISANIIAIEKSVNDEKLMELGAEINIFDVESNYVKYKMKKYIEKIIFDNTYNSFHVYGKMYKTLRNLNIKICDDSMVVEYKKI